MNYSTQMRNGRNCSSPASCTNRNVSQEALAMAYVPIQQFHTVYDLDEALRVGTIFPELNKPFYGSKGGSKCQRRA